MIEAVESNELEYGHTIADAVQEDIKAVLDWDLAYGYRVQSETSAAFAVDIHP